MEAVRSLLSALNQLVTATATVWWRTLPRLLTVVVLGWFGYRVFAQLAAMVVDVSAWLSLVMLSFGFVIKLSSIILGLRIAGEELRIRQSVPLPDDDPRDTSISHLLSITLLPFLGIYAVFDVVTEAANEIQVDYYVFGGLTFERPVLAQLNPQSSSHGVWLLLVLIVGLYLVRRLVEWWFERTGFRPLGLLAALVEGFFLLMVVLSGRQLLVSVRHWVDERTFRVWLDYPGWGLQQLLAWTGLDISAVLAQFGSWWWEVVWPGISAMVVEPMLWLALAALVFGSQVISTADLWRRGEPVSVRARRSRIEVGDRERRLALEVQQAFFGDLNDKYLPTWQSVRLVTGVGATFFAAFVLCYGVLVTGEEWLRRWLFWVLGGHPVTFWSVAGPPIDLVVTAVGEPLRWALLAAAFQACLTLLASRSGRTQPTAPEPQPAVPHPAGPDR
ncbi:MAG: hypothetical protein QM711_18745 [Micropruina sp.]|uniref:hypothetical protein n=1 Tax=Micropruina sp. TaxID=2737536 RepID=UPI0039E487EE